MLTYNMDVEERSTWLRATPGAAALARYEGRCGCHPVEQNTEET